MRNLRTHIVASIILLALWTIQPQAGPALAQKPVLSTAAAPKAASASPTREEINYDIQIYLMVGSNGPSEKAGLPSALDGVARQLRSSLPFNNYRIAATFLNRVSNGGNLQVNGVAGSLFTASPTPSFPTFYEFDLNDIKGDANAAGQQLIQVQRFKFTMRVPLATSATPTQGGGSAPNINYEPTGISTGVSILEGVPTLVGTMTTGRSDESYILVVTIRPTTGH